MLWCALKVLSPAFQCPALVAELGELAVVSVEVNRRHVHQQLVEDAAAAMQQAVVTSGQLPSRTAHKVRLGVGLQ